MGKLTYDEVKSKLWSYNGMRARVVIFFAVFAIIALFHNQVINGDRVYTSAKHGFSVTFPGKPTVTSNSLSIKHPAQAGKAQVTEYQRDTGSVVYGVYVVEYPASFDVSDGDEVLKDVLYTPPDSPSQNPMHIKLISSKFGQFAGHRSISGILTFDFQDKTHKIYKTAFLKDKTAYYLQTTDASQAEFNSFANTFKLTQK